MREKNVRRAAHALYNAQGDDKNRILAKFVKIEAARTLVEDQGRALLILEKIILPHGKNAFTEDEMYAFLMKKLKKKGHRIQDNDEEDDEKYAAEKAAWAEARKKEVPELLGFMVDDVAQEEAPKKPENPVRSRGRILPPPKLDKPKKKWYHYLNPFNWGE